MSKRTLTSNDPRLHKWVDGAEESAVLAAEFAADPGMAALARHYRQQNDALRDAFAGMLDEPVPMALVDAARGRALGSKPAPADAVTGGARPLTGAGRRQAANDPRGVGRWMLAGAMAASLAVGMALGVAAGGGRPAPAPAAAGIELSRAASIAYAAYVPEVRHPVEVGAGEQAHLVAWLSKRLGTPLRVPDLGAQGWQLVGGRLLPDDVGGVAAQFMFEAGTGQRLTLFVRHDSPDAARTDTAFRVADQGSVRTFYWVDRGFGYALSGELPRDAMLSVADAVYRQLNP